MHRGLTLAIWMLMGLAAVRSAGKWSYVGKTGPLYWHEIFPQACGGDNQSPIDLRPEETLYNPDLKDFAIWYDPPRPDSKMYIKNTGYTVQVDLKGDFFITNAGLGHMYKAVQFHFHWGHKSHHGSEHLIEGQHSPIELHVVSFNQDIYSDIGEAVQQPGGLAVLGVLFEVSEEDNPSFDYIIRGMKHIRNPEKVTKIELPLFSLRGLLPADIGRYFRYNGSLTTPGCFETVTWTVFNQKQTISARQLEEFRKLLQFKRKHHKHHHHKDDSEGPHRHRRELPGSEKAKEHNAKQVLDELGINGKDSGFEQEVLKEQLVTGKRQSKDLTKSGMMNAVEGGDNEIQTDPTEVTYVQDYIVNNFRPVQPINNRIVYRSFKLRQAVVLSQDIIAEQVQTQMLKYYSSNDNNNNNHDNNNNIGHSKSVDGGASIPNSSIALMLITSLFYFVLRLI